MIKRYDPAGYFGGHAVEHPLGDYVLFTDHEAALADLEKENGRLREALEKIDGHIVCDSSDAAAMFQEIAREALKGKP